MRRVFYYNSGFAAATYLLDLYPAAVAYSLRQLRTGVTFVIRVRRSSDNAEANFTATEIIDGTLTTWVGINDGFVVTWYDQSGNGNNISQATTANQPKLVSSGTVITKGGLPAVLFDGTNDNIGGGAFLNSVSISHFSVSASAVTSTFGIIHSQANISTATIRTFCDTRTTPSRNLVVTTSSNYFADLSTARNNTDQRLLSSFIDASKNMSGFDNGATGGTDTYVGTPTNDAFVLGKQGGVNYLNGYIQEFIGFNTDESANRTTIESDINSHYSIF